MTIASWVVWYIQPITHNLSFPRCGFLWSLGGNWRLHKSFEKTPDGLDTEELWQVTLLKANIIARQHPDICFNLQLDFEKNGCGNKLRLGNNKDTVDGRNPKANHLGCIKPH